MPADILCRVVLPNGERCGYQPSGQTAKEKIANLFRHEQEHLKIRIPPRLTVRDAPKHDTTAHE